MLARFLLQPLSASRQEGQITSPTYLMPKKSLRSLAVIASPFGCNVAVGDCCEVGRRIAIWLQTDIGLHPKRRGRGFEFGDALNEPWERDAGFPQFNSTSDKTDSGFLLVRCKIW